MKDNNFMEPDSNKDPLSGYAFTMEDNNNSDNNSFDEDNFNGDNNDNRFNNSHSSKSSTITKKGFIITLIICMIITSATTFFAVSRYYNLGGSNGNDIANYKLSSSKETLSYKDIVNKNKDSVVSITTESVATDLWAQNYITKGAGSGIIIESDGYILTCNHVIEGAQKITVTLRNRKSYTAKLVGSYPENDIAILKVNAKGLNPVTYGDSSKITVGDQALAIGNPLGELGGTATTGIISANKRSLTIDGKHMELIQTDASINPGNSGGALFDAAGNLIGVVVAKSGGSDIEGLGFAIPINKAAKLASDIIKNPQKHPEKNKEGAQIGVMVAQVDDQLAAEKNLDGAGLYITQINSDNAKKSGLKPGDKILTFDGKSIRAFDDLKPLLNSHKPGDKVKIIVKRANKNITMKVTLS